MTRGDETRRSQDASKRLVPNDESDWLTVRDAHPLLVSRRVFEHARQRRETRPSSIEQRGRDPRLKTHGKTWNGQRSRFILSGLLTCKLCGNCYQGVTRHKSKKRTDGTRVTTRYYGCGGHVTKGNRICRMNPIPQAEFESLVIDTVLDFYGPYLAKGGRRKVADALKGQLGSEGEEVAAARERAEAEHRQITGTINNLLDNITPANREFVDQRLKELSEQRRQLESRLDELDRLTASQTEIKSIAAEALRFLSGLEFTLRQGLPQEKLTALRQCIDRIHVDKPAAEVAITLRTIPAGNLDATQVMQAALATTGPAQAPSEPATQVEVSPVRPPRRGLRSAAVAGS